MPLAVQDLCAQRADPSPEGAGEGMTRGTVREGERQTGEVHSRL